jgi:hypothetical protein
MSVKDDAYHVVESVQLSAGELGAVPREHRFAHQLARA